MRSRSTRQLFSFLNFLAESVYITIDPPLFLSIRIFFSSVGLHPTSRDFYLFSFYFILKILTVCATPCVCSTCIKTAEILLCLHILPSFFFFLICSRKKLHYPPSLSLSLSCGFTVALTSAAFGKRRQFPFLSDWRVFREKARRKIFFCAYIAWFRQSFDSFSFEVGFFYHASARDLCFFY